MLVYGDRAAPAAPRRLLREITASLRKAEESGPGPKRHDLLTRAFIDAAGLMQGLADAEFETHGQDDRSVAQDAAMALLLVLARKLTASAWSGYTVIGPDVAPALMEAAMQPLPETIQVRTAEGFAFYAVFPEAYLKAAAEHPWTAPPFVIGLRSIGAGLAALVAAATAARAVLTARPCGPPFRRALQVSDQIRSEIEAHAGPFAIVDEGPGLSGSSFGAAADLLEELGVAQDRVVFLPSHPGDLGPEADPRHRARWAGAARPVATFDDLVRETPLGDWFSDLTGPVSRIDDLSGGRWRGDLAGGETWPPAHPGQERLKFRLHTASGRWLAKFAGFGGVGEAKCERARALHRAGFSPEPLSIRRGFLLERWEERGAIVRVRRERMVEHLAAYLAFRAATFPAEPHEGASREALVEMAQVNAHEALGEAAGGLLAELRRLAAAAPAGRPVHVDARLHAWEWLRTSDDRLLKSDAVDHSVAHDLVGCQDIAWDVAGAALEFGLAPAETARLQQAVEATAGERLTSARLRLFAILYPAFQVGLWRTAEPAAPPDERPRLAAQAARYVTQLAKLAASAESAD
jgi:hypothetical protein